MISFGADCIPGGGGGGGELIPIFSGEEMEANRG